MIQDPGRDDTGRDVDAELDVDVESKSDHPILEDDAGVVGDDDNQDVDVGIRGGIAASFRPEQPDINEMF